MVSSAAHQLCLDPWLHSGHFHALKRCQISIIVPSSPSNKCHHRLYSYATFAWFLGQYWHLEICPLFILRQMPQTIINISRCLPQILPLPGVLLSFSAFIFSEKMALLTLRGWVCPLKAKRAIFFPKRSSRNDTKNSWHWQKSAQPSEIFVSGHLSERGSEFEKRWTFSFQDKEWRAQK